MTYPTVKDYIAVYLTQEQYSRKVDRLIRRMHDGTLDKFNFIDLMIGEMENAFERAWRQGAAECGFGPDERTDQERDALNAFIFQNAQYVPGFATAIDDSITSAEYSEATQKDRKKDLERFLTRGQMWANRFSEVANLARQLACADKKLQWQVGPTEHCSDCSKLNGRTYRASTWAASGVRPQSSELECGGFRCQCQLVPTNEPGNRGRVPALTGR